MTASFSTRSSAWLARNMRASLSILDTHTLSSHAQTQRTRKNDSCSKLAQTNTLPGHCSSNVDFRPSSIRHLRSVARQRHRHAVRHSTEVTSHNYESAQLAACEHSTQTFLILFWCQQVWCGRSLRPSDTAQHRVLRASQQTF